MIAVGNDFVFPNIEGYGPLPKLIYQNTIHVIVPCNPASSFIPLISPSHPKYILDFDKLPFILVQNISQCMCQNSKRFFDRVKVEKER